MHDDVTGPADDLEDTLPLPAVAAEEPTVRIEGAPVEQAPGTDTTREEDREPPTPSTPR
ncbi:hypothetical protein [Serinibacter arcticus]|nr:hypothetical protein [Serinibacter arcticus]